ncbi:DUF2953 domain-containing protein [Pararhodobacter marinus]|uniref:DUF2953 domain-containing protein n=1 Tax=Pararhodobacter marinus TaxID=2184063 RepID=UPI003515C9FA
MASVLIWLLVACLVLLAGLLVLPLRLEARLGRDQARLRLWLGLAAGLLRIPVFDSARPAEESPQAKPAPAVETAPRRSRSGARRGRFLRALPRVALDTLHCLRIERAEGVIRLGLGDPALTGEAYGRAMGLVAATPLRGRLQLVPVFDRATLDGDGVVILSVVPARLVPIAARLAWALRPGGLTGKAHRRRA